MQGLYYPFVQRITPAYTGKSLGFPNPSKKLKDHPRIHGEKVLKVCQVLQAEGSPPHTRGKVFMHVNFLLLLRITPAYTGKREYKELIGYDVKDHPRIHGEKHSTYRRHLTIMGSPPHTRGKDKTTLQKYARTGITPAYTGKSLPFDECHPWLWDHPRIHGEKLFVFTDVANDMGSPPHTRGKVYSWSVGNAAIGITPAYTGKRLKRSL